MQYGMIVEKKTIGNAEFLVVTVPINNPLKSSASGKTLLVASSNGNQPTTVTIEGKVVILGFNAYVKK